MIAAIGRYIYARLFSGRKSLTCKETTDFLMAYLDGELSEPVRTEFELHMSVCRGCRVFMDSYRTTIMLSKESMCGEAAPKMPPELSAAIMAAIRKELPGREIRGERD